MRHFVLLLAALTGCAHDEEAPHRERKPCLTADGLDVKGVQHKDFPLDVLPIALAGLRCVTISFPWHTFGTSTAALDAFADQSTADEIFLRIDLFNATCLRHPALGCHDGDFFAGLTPEEVNTLIENKDPATMLAFTMRLNEIRDYVDNQPHVVTPLISIGLEFNLSKKAAQNLLALVADTWPGVLTVSNPMSGVLDDGATYHEIHGSDVSCGGLVDVVSQDGADIDGPDDDSRFLRGAGTGCFARLLWRAQWQGRSPGLSPTTTPPRDRAISFTREDAEQVNQALRAAQ